MMIIGLLMNQIFKIMAQHKHQSVYDILRGRFCFTDEKWWVRILLVLMTVIFWLVVAYCLKEAIIVKLILLLKKKRLPLSL